MTSVFLEALMPYILLTALTNLATAVTIGSLAYRWGREDGFDRAIQLTDQEYRYD